MSPCLLLPAFLTRASALVWRLGILGLLAGCTAIDPEYRAREVAALVQCRGDEIVGVWVSKLTNVGFPQRRTLLLRPDGTGRLRVLTEGVMEQEYEVLWKHSGGGVWDGTLLQHGHTAYIIQMHTTGRELLYHVRNINNVHAVFVRASDDAAVNAYLQRR